ncbi:LPS assembly lipoprotein LptE [Paraferrimonas sedimenticola]|uniref:LPS-assembly lipoprotein LptE n=1 Tax=Paraferrimonas sedimenticola TaxID=375674 RepID=A0AA37RYV7_9GAMM|nr:LPS assembly lipoprotein LptE [Paraferrimonas sedimenticola]GLP98010.1 LPS-assembly lipoprotein LptE [Paraferrimonas sedimenticola]
MKLSGALRALIGFGLTLSLLFSSGCGFRLQGSYQIPDTLQTIHLSSNDQYSELTRLLSERLRVNNVQLVDSDPQTVPELRLINDRLERSTLSLFPSGKVAEYELIYTVDFAVSQPGREPRAESVIIRRDYLDDPRTALAKSREMDMLLKEMRQQAADRIVIVLASFSES